MAKNPRVDRTNRGGVHLRNGVDLAKIQTALDRSRGKRPPAIFRELCEEFPEQSLTWGRFERIYRPDITAQELLENLFGLATSARSAGRANQENKKHGNRRDPFDIRKPKSRTNGRWKDWCDNLAITCADGIDGCRDFERKTHSRWERDRNFLYVMEAFCCRVDQLARDRDEHRKGIDQELLAAIDEMNPEGSEILVPLWMASAIADGFKHYLSRRVYHQDRNATLDGVFKVDGKKIWRDFDTAIVDKSAILEKTRDVQWHCRLAFAPALRFAIRIVAAECSCEPGVFAVEHPKANTLIHDEAHGLHPSLGAWLDDNGLGRTPDDHQVESFLAYVHSLNAKIRKDIEAAMKDRRHQL